MASPAKSATSAADMAKEGADAVRATVSLAEGESTFQSLDPLDPRKVALDIFEVYCQEMLTTTFVGRRVFLVTKLRVSRIITIINSSLLFMSTPRSPAAGRALGLLIIGREGEDVVLIGNDH